MKELADAQVHVVQFCSPYEDYMSMDNLITPLSRPAPTSAAQFLRLTAEEADRLLRVIGGSQAIQRHQELFVWLRGDLQEFLPHEILICAYGDFGTWQIKLDIASALPGARTAQLAQCSIDELVEDLHSDWVASGRRPLILRPDDVLALHGQCACPLHSALREMRTLLVHGVRDARDEHDSLYIALHRASFTRGRPKDRFLLLLDLLLPLLDIGFRRVSPYPLTATMSEPRGRNAWLNLSAREQEILEWVCRGETNLDIARALEISRFTVKNHVQRIYRKIGVSNRTQAATTYNRVFRELLSSVARSGV